MSGVALVDSSAFLSLEDPDERSHREARRALEDMVEAGTRLVTTNFVFDETYTLILARLGRGRAVTWGERFMSGKLVLVYRVEQRHEARAWDIILTFSDKDFSYTDATSFAVAEDFGIDSAFSLDRHFHQYGSLRVVPGT
ncbi:MAG: PIN domain-containing protein [Actinomycetota bacterium]|nr:PIN domain-containing protein [Actinomycetota bacterium]